LVLKVCREFDGVTLAGKPFHVPWLVVCVVEATSRSMLAVTWSRGNCFRDRLFPLLGVHMLMVQIQLLMTLPKEIVLTLMTSHRF